MDIRSRFIVILLVSTLLSIANTSAMTGAWRGELAVGQTKLPLIFNFTEDADGSTLCTIDSPLQGAKGIPAIVEICTPDSISLKCNAIGAAYSGHILNGSIKGNFKQRGYSFPLNLEPEAPIEERRPQTPRPPFPYNVTDTTFTAADGSVMSATLSMPRQSGNKQVPVVLMVSGSGPQNRDEEIFEHKPFAVIADYLACNGIGSLRYDDRGTGKSTGDFLTATTETFKNDAHSGISFLRTLPQVGKVGVIGHSEGGTIAFMLAAEGSPDFIVSLAGMALSGKETLMNQNNHALDIAGVNGIDKENRLKLISIIFDIMAEQNQKGIFESIDIDSIYADSGLTVDPQIISSLKLNQKIRTSWYDAFLNLDPRKYLTNIKCPVLALNGAKDTQVDGASNLAVIQQLVPHADTRMLPDLNHLMQHSTTGEVKEYSEIRETISPEVLEIIVTFITDATQTNHR